MKQIILTKDTAKIAGASHEELSRLLNKYIHLDKQQDAAIRNTEIALEQSKNNKVKIKEVIAKLNIAMIKYNTAVLYTIDGRRVQVDIEDRELFLKDKHVDGNVYIFKKVRKKTSLVNTLTIADFQLQYGEQLAPMYEVKEIAKNTFIMIGYEDKVMEMIQANNATVEA